MTSFLYSIKEIFLPGNWNTKGFIAFSYSLQYIIFSNIIDTFYYGRLLQTYFLSKPLLFLFKYIGGSITTYIQKCSFSRDNIYFVFYAFNVLRYFWHISFSKNDGPSKLHLVCKASIVCCDCMIFVDEIYSVYELEIYLDRFYSYFIKLNWGETITETGYTVEWQKESILLT